MIIGDETMPGTSSELAKSETLPIDEHHTRQHLMMLRRAIENGWEIPQEWHKRLPQVAAGILAESKDNRVKLRAIELLMAMWSKKLELQLEVAKIEAALNRSITVGMEGEGFRTVLKIIEGVDASKL